jgi:hypothetical protein
MNEIIKSKNFKIAAGIVGVILIALISFGLGAGVGFRKARFSYAWGENYERNFMPAPPPGPNGMFAEFEGRGFRNAHGLAGNIISISENNLIIKDMDGKENTVSVTDKSIIKNRNNDLKLNDLKQGDRVVIIGNPSDNGVVNADLIRIFNSGENNNNN